MNPVNPNKFNKSRAIATSTAFTKRVLVPRLRFGLRRLPQPAKNTINAAFRSIKDWNRYYAPRGEMDRNLRRQLIEEFSQEISKLDGILDRDLSHWRQ
ncbi:MAG: hypothetical protein IIC71_03815 [Acidobacteria bacterium]|nr:hypothetical protein [Acidobacteriota bacterium]